jgi:sulfide:quinone oxidoreductase
MSLSSAAASLQRSRDPAPPRVLIAGGGVAGLQTLPALRALAGDRLEIAIPAADLKFSNRPTSAPTPFNPNEE